MGQDAFVDVVYRGLEVGRRLKLHDVGPCTAHLEHGTPMPVGCELAIRTDAGLTIRVTVIRVHEQVAGAELPPGMRVKVDDLEGDAAGWWGALVTRQDPEIPELPVAPVVPMPRGDEQIAEAPEPEETEVVQPRAHDTTVMNVPELAAVLAAAEAMEEREAEGSGNGAAGKRDLASAPQAGRTMVMSAAEIQAITGEIPVDEEPEGEEGTETAPDPSAPRTDAGNGEPGANGDELRGKSRGKRKRGRKR